jgi:ATP-dependent Clp protease ATP-binding subunit ClpX
MTTGTVKYSKPACSFCGAGDEGCGLLIQVEDKNIFICDQCVRGITHLLKANPGRKRPRYLPKGNKKF